MARRPDLPRGEDIDIVFDADVAADMARDPKMAEAIRRFCANMRQAAEAVREGRYETMEDALEAITGHRPQQVAAMAEKFNEEEDD